MDINKTDEDFMAFVLKLLSDDVGFLKPVPLKILIAIHILQRKNDMKMVSRRNIISEVGITHVTLGKYLNELIDMDLIVIERKGKYRRVEKRERKQPYLYGINYSMIPKSDNIKDSNNQFDITEF